MVSLTGLCGSGGKSVSLRPRGGVSVGEWVVSGGLSWLGGSIGGGGWLVFGFLDFFVALFAILGVCIEERER
jgi:hypothetical protein